MLASTLMLIALLCAGVFIKVPYAEMSGAHASLDGTAGLLAETAAAISAGVGGRRAGEIRSLIPAG